MNTRVTISPESGGQPATSPLLIHNLLLVCGIASSVLYILTVELAAFAWEGYDANAQTISELIAIDAPTRPLVAVLFTIYALLVFAFGYGVWQLGRYKPILRITAIALIAKEVLGAAVTLFAPIHLRGVEPTMSDTMHVILTMVGLLFMLLAMGSAAGTLGRGFRLYTFATILIFVASGVLAFGDADKVAANLPTPWLGVIERVTSFSYMLWVIVLAILLLRLLADRRKVQA